MGTGNALFFILLAIKASVSAPVFFLSSLQTTSLSLITNLPKMQFSTIAIFAAAAASVSAAANGTNTTRTRTSVKTSSQLVTITSCSGGCPTTLPANITTYVAGANKQVAAGAVALAAGALLAL